MLPLTLLKAAQNRPMLVELKNGETFNGHLVSCDNWMNINLSNVICTSREGDKFWHLNECYIKGTMIKYLRIPDEVIDTVKEDVRNQQHSYSQSRGKDSNYQRDNQGQRRPNRRQGGPNNHNNHNNRHQKNHY